MSAVATPARRPGGRPKSPAPALTVQYHVCATPAHRKWLDRFRARLGNPDVSSVIRDGLRALAELNGFEAPPAK